MATDAPTLKVAVITGASSGIGREAALALARAGWSLVLFSRRATLLEDTKRACPDPDACLVVEGDVCSEEDVVRLFQQAVERFGASYLFGILSVLNIRPGLGRIDLLFNVRLPRHFHSPRATNCPPIERGHLVCAAAH